MTAFGCGVSLWGDGNSLELMMFAHVMKTLCEILKTTKLYSFFLMFIDLFILREREREEG